MTTKKTNRVPTVVTFLEMKSRPSVIPPPPPKGKIALLKAERPPLHFYRYLYDAVGRNYKWVDRKKLGDPELNQILGDARVELYVLYAEGCPAGFAELDFRDVANAQLAYFGLMPEFIGRKLSFYFLYQIAANAWMRPVSKLLVNTCTLDHPRALPLYQRIGFVPYSREDRYIEIPPGL